MPKNEDAEKWRVRMDTPKFEHIGCAIQPGSKFYRSLT